MSDTVLKFVPADPHFLPSARQRKVALSLLEELIEGEMPEEETYENVAFIDQGENLEAVLCSGCSSRVDLYGPQAPPNFAEQVFELVNETEEATVESLTVNMPCCGMHVPFTSLRFDWPAAFGRFELSIWNPEVDRPVPEELRQRLEAAVGMPLLEVWAHY